MSVATIDGGSFRDPGGRIYAFGDRILRSVMQSSASEYVAARDAGLYETLASKKMLLSTGEVDPKSVDLRVNPDYLLEHPKLPYVSYPYEWDFSLLKRAALHHLDVQMEALDMGFSLSDATAYNIQFKGVDPVFIDHLSFKQYEPGELWVGHRQFCMQFLNPLIMWSKLGVAPNAWFRGSLEGIPPEELSKLLSWTDNFSWTVLSHVTGQAILQRKANEGQFEGKESKKATLSPTAFRAMLDGLHRFISKLKLPKETTVWGDYAGNNSYASSEAQAKNRIIRNMVEKAKPSLLFDLGCNSGDYSVAALEAGAEYVVGFDFDFGALEHAVARADQENLNFLPLWFDAANPSPSQGWAEKERKGIGERANADVVIALAFIHHIAIGRNIPLDMVLEWIIAMAPVGIIEFPPKSDPMVQRLLANREDIFPDYNEAYFLQEIGKRARTVESTHLSDDGRLLVWFDRS